VNTTALEAVLPEARFLHHHHLTTDDWCCTWWLPRKRATADQAATAKLRTDRHLRHFAQSLPRAMLCDSGSSLSHLAEPQFCCMAATTSPLHWKPSIPADRAPRSSTPLHRAKMPS
jgi:hypothetical protein